jgi:putative Mg2+ transporter-C (MgtC) family protein
MHVFQNAIDVLRQEMAVVLSSTILRLIVAAILGGIIGLERELHHKPAGLRTNMFICFGAAMFTVLSDELAAGFGGDHTRIAAQIIPGIGFIGAGSILHSRGSVSGLTTAATLFVVASIGMAAGGGLYLTAIFATGVILIALAVLGRMEKSFELKFVRMNYEVTGENTEVILSEVNHILDELGKTVMDVRAAAGGGQSRVEFSVDGSKLEQQKLNRLLRQSSHFHSVSALGGEERE